MYVNHFIYVLQCNDHFIYSFCVHLFYSLFSPPGVNGNSCQFSLPNAHSTMSSMLMLIVTNRWIYYCLSIHFLMINVNVYLMLHCTCFSKCVSFLPPRSRSTIYSAIGCKCGKERRTENSVYIHETFTNKKSIEYSENGDIAIQFQFILEIDIKRKTNTYIHKRDDRYILLLVLSMQKLSKK